MKVLLFAPSRSVHTHKWALYFQQAGIEVEVVTFYDHYLAEHANQVKTHCLPKTLPGKLSYLSSVISLKRILRRFQPDIFHAHYLSSYGFIASLTGYRPLITSVWGSDIYHFPQIHWMNRKMVTRALERSDLICSTSRAMAQEIAKYTDQNVEITPFGVDTTYFRPSPSQPSSQQVTIGIVKGMKDVYGIPELIDAFAEVAKKHSHVRLLLVGDGSERSKYEEQVRRLDLQTVTQFAGYIPNQEIVSYYHKMDIYVLPSHRESFGVSALEAQACGIPVIVNGVDGLPEVVQENETGWIIKNNRPESIADAINQLVENKDERIRMGKNGTQFVRKHYDWNQLSQHMISLYRSYFT